MKHQQSPGNSYDVFAKRRKNMILLIILLANVFCSAAIAQKATVPNTAEKNMLTNTSEKGIPSSIYDFKVRALNGGTTNPT